MADEEIVEILSNGVSYARKLNRNKVYKIANHKFNPKYLVKKMYQLTS